MTIPQLTATIEHIKETGIQNIVYYEFGVYLGDSLIKVKELCQQYKITLSQMYGFDSFEGLPSEQDGINVWYNFVKGKFDNRQYYGVNVPKEVATIIHHKVGYDVPLEMIVGFYKQSLNKDLVYNLQLRPADLVYMDADLYISTYQALEFMIQNNLLKKGCIIAYDEWNSAKNGGEELAHMEICEKYNIIMEENFTDHLLHPQHEDGIWMQKSFVFKGVH